jgi:hypothetical protein
VINASGKAIKANMKSVTAAAATAKIPDDLRYSITNSAWRKPIRSPARSGRWSTSSSPPTRCTC